MKTPRSVITIALAAQQLGVDEELLWYIQLGMDEYDGLMWIYDVDGAQTIGFTPWGMENLEQELADRLPDAPKPPSATS